MNEKHEGETVCYQLLKAADTKACLTTWAINPILFITIAYPFDTYPNKWFSMKTMQVQTIFSDLPQCTSPSDHQTDHQLSASDDCIVFKFWLKISWNMVCSRRHAKPKSPLVWICKDEIFEGYFALSFRHICRSKVVLFCGYPYCPPPTVITIKKIQVTNPELLQLRCFCDYPQQQICFTESRNNNAN